MQNERNLGKVRSIEKILSKRDMVRESSERYLGCVMYFFLTNVHSALTLIPSNILQPDPWAHEEDWHTQYETCVDGCWRHYFRVLVWGRIRCPSYRVPTAKAWRGERGLNSAKTRSLDLKSERRVQGFRSNVVPSIHA